MKITTRCGEAAVTGLNEALLVKAAAAKLLRTDKVRNAMRLRPVPELQKHQPQIGFHRDRRPTDPSIEVRGERREEHRIIQQHIHPTQLDGQHQQLGRQDRIP